MRGPSWTQQQLTILSKEYKSTPIQELKAKINDAGPPRSILAIQSKAAERGLTVKFLAAKDFARPLGVHYSTVKRWLIDAGYVKNSSEKVAIPSEKFAEVMAVLEKRRVDPKVLENYMNLSEVAKEISYAQGVLIRQARHIFKDVQKFSGVLYVPKKEVIELKNKLKTQSLNKIIGETNQTYLNRQKELKKNYRMDAVSKFIEAVAPVHERYGFDRRALAIDTMLAKTVINKNVPTYYVVRKKSTFFVLKQQYNPDNSELSFRPKLDDVVFLIHSHSVIRAEIC